MYRRACSGKHDLHLFDRGGRSWCLWQMVFLWHTISVREPRRRKEGKPSTGSRTTFPLGLVHLRKHLNLWKTKNRTTKIQALWAMTTVIQHCLVFILVTSYCCIVFDLVQMKLRLSLRSWAVTMFGGDIVIPDGLRASADFKTFRKLSSNESIL